MTRPWRIVKRHKHVLLYHIYCWVFFEGIWLRELKFIYWQYMIKIKERRPTMSYVRRKNEHWSGFMSQSRGLHWDRKSRYGEK